MYQQRKQQPGNEEGQEGGLAAATEEEDPFGFAGCGMDDGPDGYQGLYEDHEDCRAPALTEVRPPLEQQPHDWIWTGKTWHCAECFRQTRNRKKYPIECRGLPALPSTL